METVYILQLKNLPQVGVYTW